MSKIGDNVLTEKTRVAVTVAKFVMLVFAITSGVAVLVNWKSDIEHRLNYTENEIIIIKKDTSENNDLLQVNLTVMAEIQTDIKWLRAYMERGQ